MRYQLLLTGSYRQDLLDFEQIYQQEILSYLSRTLILPIIFALCAILLDIFLIIAKWKLYKKMGYKGWKSLIPFYSTWLFYKAITGNGWNMFRLLIPFYNIYYATIMCYVEAKAFGKGINFGFGLYFLDPIFTLILAFGSAQYIGAYKGTDFGDNDYSIHNFSGSSAGSILVTGGQYQGAKLSLDRVLVIGRDPDVAQFVLDNPNASRKHCIITYDFNLKQYYVEDCSSNGIFRADGSRLPSGRKMPFSRGEEIVIKNARGDDRFRFE